MKFNLTKDKLTRVLLSANPVLANCKGSKKAVRLFLNMLGMKNIITSQIVQASFTLTGLTDVQNDDSYLANITTQIIGIIDAAHTTFYIAPVRSSGGMYFGGMLGIHDKTGTRIEIVNIVVEYLSSTSVNIKLVPLSSAEINAWNTDHTDAKIIDATVNDINDALTKAYAQFVSLFNARNKSAYQYIGNAVISKSGVSTSQYSVSNETYTILVTNVVDEQLRPVKSVLVKQLQEILPINMIVEADNIIGCAINE